jgi:hypothetical protein
MHKRLVTLCAVLIFGSSAAVQPVSAAGFSFATSMRSAAQARQVPLVVIEAIAYVNTRWDVINQPAFDHGFLPMDITPAHVDQAAALSGHSVAEIETDPAANIDAAAALLANYHMGGTDLASWQPAVASLVGPYVAVEVYQTLRSGETRTTSAGETITLAAQPLATTTPSISGGAASVAGTTVVAGATVASTDYPPAAWVPASTANYSTADRPHDYQVDMIVIHDIEGSAGSAIQEFQNPATQASAHYVVSAAGDITQMVAEHDIAWHAGNWDYNTRSIGIEHEGFACCNYYTTAEYQASAKLAASICSRWGVPMDRTHVIGHYEVPDPNNPGQFGGAGHHTDPGAYWNWTYYMSQAVAFANALPSPPHLGPDPTATPGDKTASVDWQPAHTCTKPITGYTVVANPGNIVQNLPASATHAAFSGLQNGVSYKITVTASNPDGQSSLTSVTVIPGPFPFKGLYTVDGFGGVHGDGSSELPTTAYWPGWTIARSAKTLPVSSGPPLTGFVLDGYGRLHRFGAALTETTGVTEHAWGWDIARDFAFLPDGTGGFVLDGYGGLHPFRVNGNTAPLQAQGAPRWGWDIARKVVIFPDGTGGYTLDGYGGIHSFGINGPPPASTATLTGGGYWPGWQIVSDIVLVPGNGNHSGYILDGYGGVHPFHPTADGSSMPAAIETPRWGFDIARSLWLGAASTAAAPKGYLLDGSGGLYQFGAVPTPPFPYWPGSDIAIRLVGE